MKYIYIYTAILFALIASCSDENTLSSNTPVPTEDRTGVMSSDYFFDYEDSITTRTTIGLSGGTVTYRWDNGDVLNVFAYKDDCIDIGATNFTIFNSTGNDAKFNGSGFRLDPEYDYYSLGRYDAKHTNIQDIKISYQGQRMPERESMANLGLYEFQASHGTNITDHSAYFRYKHLGAVVRFVFNKLPQNTAFKKLTIYKEDQSEIKYDRHVNLLAGGGEGDAYNPKLFTDPEDNANTTFEVALGPDDATGISTGEGTSLTTYMMMPNNTDFKNKTWYVLLTKVGEDSPSYYMTLPGRDEFVGGKAYSYTRDAIETGKLSIQISVDRAWQLGNTVTRTGDPGIDEGLERPTDVVVYTCIDGKVHNTTHLNEIGASEWAEAGSVLNLKRTVTIDYTSASNITVYAYAYKQNTFTPSTTITDGTTTEEALCEFLFSSSDETTLKNLYSTAYTTTPAFQGIVDMSKDLKSVHLTLYHVAAKVDVQWSSPLTPLPTSGDDAFVKINNVQSTGLKLFKPTENAYSTGTWTTSVAITPGTMYYGRHVFYLPQFTNACKYNISVGGASSDPNNDNVIFTPSTTNGWTSWLKANINK